MGAWNATIFGNDTSLDIKEEFFRRYNLGEEVEDIKNSLLLEAYDEDRFNVIFALAYCMWEVGQLDNKFLNEVKNIIDNEEDLKVNEELGADAKFIKQRIKNLEKFLEKISIKKEKPKKRVAPPVEVESKYKSGAVMAFQYLDGMWGALISINGQFFDKKTIYRFIQTTVKTLTKPSMNDVLASYIMDLNFHDAERNSYPARSPFFYYCFDNCIAQYLKARATKRFESYNDSFFEIIGYLSDWGECNGGIYATFDYDKKVDEFREHARKMLTAIYDKESNNHTKMTVAEIEKEFLTRLLTR